MYIVLQLLKTFLPWNITLWDSTVVGETLLKMTGFATNDPPKGYANVPLDAPGLGIELNDEEVKKTSEL